MKISNCSVFCEGNIAAGFWQYYEINPNSSSSKFFIKGNVAEWSEYVTMVLIQSAMWTVKLVSVHSYCFKYSSRIRSELGK